MATVDKSGGRIQDARHYEDVIRKMKVLSMSQSTFLKAFVHWKLSSGVSLVQRSLDLLNTKGNHNDPRIIELKKALLELKLNELDVDVNSSQLMMQEEVTLLRHHVDSEVNKVLGEPNKNQNDNSNPGLGNQDREKLNALENENSNLRGKIKELEDALTRASAIRSPSTSTPQPGLSMEEGQKLRQQISMSESKLRELETQLKSEKEVARSKEDEITRLNSYIQSKTSGSDMLNKELSVSKAEIEKLQSTIQSLKIENDRAMQAKMKELNDDADNRIKELTKKLESDKEMMMDAMAQEVDVLEEAKKKEATAFQSKIKSLEDSLVTAQKAADEKLISSLEALKQSHKREVEPLNVKIVSLEKSLEVANASKQKLSASVLKVVTNSRHISASAASNVRQIKQEFEDFKAYIASSMSGALLRKIKGIDDQFTALNAKYKREMAERKKLHNTIQELKGNIRVFMRCRPPTAKEIDQFGPDQLCIAFPGPGEVKVFNEKSREKSWEFDEVFGIDSTQEDVYKDVSDLVVSVLDGYNVCIFACKPGASNDFDSLLFYRALDGQTGSGKTWTMSGPPDNRGVNFRALNELFERTQSRMAECNDVITVSILEVYNEDIRDLLVDPSAQEKLEVRQGEFGHHVPGLTMNTVRNLQQVIDLLAIADRYRSQTTTNMNEHSSRSHMLMTVNIVSENRITGTLSRGKLNLVDLAGSERINKSGATGQALKEAQNINKSLLALGDVIAARAAKQNHVPFRNSTLTYLLQDSLSQDSKTLMIVCASPMLYNSEETFCSLNFASRVRTVELGKATKNVSGSSTAASASASATSSSKRK